MLEFEEIQLSDKPWIDEVLSYEEHMSCEYCFGNLYIWKYAYDVKVARYGDFLIARLTSDSGEEGISYLFPAGRGDLQAAIDELIAHCKETETALTFIGATEENVAFMEALYPGEFHCSSNRDYAEYIYKVEDLTNLSGKKYHGKRNHIARFSENNWSFEPITAQNIPECKAMSREWHKYSDCGKDSELAEEFRATSRSMKHFEELGFFGGLLRVDGRVVAFTLAERLNQTTVVVHLEKAFAEIQGAYAVINREFLKNMCQEYTYVNREEDLGVEGLRKAKLSYRPVILLEKYTAVYHGQLIMKESPCIPNLMEV